MSAMIKNPEQESDIRIVASKTAREKRVENIKQWLLDLTSYSSLHGLAWYNRTDNVYAKALIILIAVPIIFALPIVFGVELANFLTDTRVNTAVEWKTAETIVYPNITVCHALFFSKEKLQRFNISDGLANYMTMAIDPYIRSTSDYMSRMFPPGVYFAMLKEFGEQLNAILKEHKLTNLLDLFYLVAVDCNEMIVFCEDHRKFYGSANDGTVPCCEIMFHKVPIFSPSGTCFTSKIEVFETSPSIFSSIKVWLYVDKNKSPAFDIQLKGSDAAEREGIYWTISYEDHPSKLLYTSPKKAAVGSSTIVALTKSEVDRTGLSEVCLNKSKPFEELFGIDSTRLNCEMLVSHFLVANCSVGVYSGLKQVGNIGPCMPADTLNHTDQTGRLDEMTAADYGYTRNSCPFDCFHTYYDMRVSVGEFDKDSLNRIFNTPLYGSNYSADYSVAIQFYFETFDHAKSVVYTDGFFDFLSKIGGWMSITIGASVISFIEIVFFLAYLAKTFLKNLICV